MLPTDHPDAHWHDEPDLPWWHYVLLGGAALEDAAADDRKAVELLREAKIDLEAVLSALEYVHVIMLRKGEGVSSAHYELKVRAHSTLHRIDTITGANHEAK